MIIYEQKDYFATAVKSVGVTGNGLLDGVICKIIAAIVHLIVFPFVGVFYALKIISGAKAGRIMYTIVWLLLSVFILSFIRLFFK